MGSMKAQRVGPMSAQANGLGNQAAVCGIQPQRGGPNVRSNQINNSSPIKLRKAFQLRLYGEGKYRFQKLNNHVDLMKHTWRRWLQRMLSGPIKCRSPGRVRARPCLESLEDRTLPSGAFPFVQSIDRTNPAGPITNAASVTYTVVFSEPVTGVDPTDWVARPVNLT
jgi:hypothetical protein